MLKADDVRGAGSRCANVRRYDKGCWGQIVLLRVVGRASLRHCEVGDMCQGRTRCEVQGVNVQMPAGTMAGV